MLNALPMFSPPSNPRVGTVTVPIYRGHDGGQEGLNNFLDHVVLNGKVRFEVWAL